MKYKHKITGIIGETNEKDNFLHFIRSHGNIGAKESISMELVEDSNDWIKLDDDILPTPWYTTRQIETWIGESLTTEGKKIEELKGGRGKLIIMHQCGNNKAELISQLECMIDGIKSDFDGFAE